MAWKQLWVAVAAPLAFGCTGNLLDAPTGPNRPNSPKDPSGYVPPTGRLDCPSGNVSLGTTPTRRLSHFEYLNTMQDLFAGFTPASLPPLPPATTVVGFENDSPSLEASAQLVDRWEQYAYAYASAATANDAALARFLPCAASASSEASQRSCGASFIRDFGKRALRRPLSSAEQEELVAFFEEQRTTIDFRAAIQLTAMALAQSPEMIYRLELDGTSKDGRIELTAFELASRLAFLIWGTAPDAELLAAAEAGELATSEGIAERARTMLESPRARLAFTDFHRQWLDLNRILDDEHQSRVSGLYPDWTPAMQQAAFEESRRFIESYFFGEGTLDSLFTSNRAFVNASIADLYGVPGPANDSTWQEVSLPEDERAGILTRAGFLAARAHSANGSPPLRGVFVMERLLCERLPSPPGNADTTPPVNAPGAPARTNRELFEERTAPQQCRGCHVRIDGIGMGFENFDAIGAFRDADNGLPVDATGQLIGTGTSDGEYGDALELSEKLADSSVVQQCAVRQMLRYAQGRAPEMGEACLIQDLTDRLQASGGNMRELVVEFVSRPEFRLRTPIQ